MWRFALITFCVAVSLLQVSCLRDSYWVKLSGPVSVGGEWVEFRPESPLKAEKTFQQVVLELEPPLKYDLMNEGDGPDAGKGILMPGGEVINPEIEVLDQYGNTFRLVWNGARGWAGGSGPTYGMPYPSELPRDRAYMAVRIRSPKPIKSKAVYWFCDSSKDWK